jgi:hypothetical protein
VIITDGDLKVKLINSYLLYLIPLMYIMAKAEYCQLHSRMVIPFCNKIHSNHIRLLATWSCENWIHSGLKWLTMSTTQPCLSLPSPLPCIYQLWGQCPTRLWGPTSYPTKLTNLSREMLYTML